MITNEMLRVAAARSNEMLVKYYEQDYEPSGEHKFSPQFEKKMKRLCRRANHPILYRTIQHVASVLLAVLVGGTVWLSVDVEARATFLGWVREKYENYIVYRFEGMASNNIGEVLYYPSWVPEGYTEDFCEKNAGVHIISYKDSLGRRISFEYINNPDDAPWFIDQTNMTIRQTHVNGAFAELYLSNNSKTANSLMWINSDNTSFLITAFLDEDSLIKIAESVQK